MSKHLEYCNQYKIQSEPAGQDIFATGRNLARIQIFELTDFWKCPESYKSSVHHLLVSRIHTASNSKKNQNETKALTVQRVSNPTESSTSWITKIFSVDTSTVLEHHSTGSCISNIFASYQCSYSSFWSELTPWHDVEPCHGADSAEKSSSLTELPQCLIEQWRLAQWQWPSPTGP